MAVLIYAVITTITTVFLAYQYWSCRELSGHVQSTSQCEPCECDQRDDMYYSSNPDTCNSDKSPDPCQCEKVSHAHSLRFHLERSGRNGLRTDKIYPCLTNKIHSLGPYRVIANKLKGKIFVSERHGHFVSVRDLNGTVIRKYGSHGEGKGKMTSPAGIALDDQGFMYVTSDHKLQKFSSDQGSVIAEVGRTKPGNNQGNEFNKPYTVAIRNDKVFVCDSENDRIQVFDLDLHFLECIATDVKKPQDIAFDNEGKMYVTSKSENRVYVFNESGNKVHQFGQRNSDGNGLSEPTGIHIYGNLALVSDEGVNGIMVYNITGHFITSFEGFRNPRGITSDDKGQIYICDYRHDRIVVL